MKFEVPAKDDHPVVPPGERTVSSNGFSPEAVQKQLEKVLASETFSHSERLRRFLRFIVDQTKGGRGEHLKEYQIGLSVFDRKDSFDSRLDPIVRVEARRLRTKLKEYYDTEGENDSLIIELPKGSYVPAFQQRGPKEPADGQDKEQLRLPRRWAAVAAAIALIVVCGTVYWGFSLRSENRKLRSQLEVAGSHSIGPEFKPIWRQVLSPDAQNYVVFGSPLFLEIEGERFFLRSFDVNSPVDLFNNPRFSALQERFGKVTGPRYDYALMGDAIALQRLGSFLGRAGVKVNALGANVATWDTLKDGNVIFLGPPRMDPLLQNLPAPQDFVWQGDTVINKAPRPGEQARYESPSHRDKLTYALISSLPGLRKNRQLLLLTAHSAPGTLAAVETVTRSQGVIEMTERLGLKNSGSETYYQLLLKVYVDKGDLVRSEYLTHHIITKP